MKKYASLAFLFAPTLAHAVAGSQTGTALDNLIPNWSSFIVNTLIPFMGVCGVVWGMYCLYCGHRHGWAIRLVLALSVGALGLPGISRMFGGGLVSAAIWA